jgi:glycosyltransferase involved in cell wall biosynthesis
VKVLVLLNKFPFGEADGGAAVSRALARDVLALDAQARIIIPHTPKHPFNIAKIPEKFSPSRWQPFACDTRLNVKGLIAAMAQGRTYHLWRYDRPHQSAELVRAVKAFMPDVCVLEGMAGLAFLPVFRHNFPCLPLVYYAHNVEWQVWHGIEKGLPLLHPAKLMFRWIWKSLKREEESNWNLATRITGVSSEDVEIMAARVGKKLSSPLFPGLWEALPPMLEAPIHPSEPLRLYHLGAMDWAPNREGVTYFLWKVWPVIKKAIPQAELYLAGKNMPISLRRIKIRGVHVEGYVKNVEDFLRDKHVCVAPQLSGSGIRIKVLEAMAYGKPVVASPKGVEGLPVRAGRHVLVAESPEGYVQHLLQLMQDTASCRKMIEEARNLVSTYFTKDQSGAALRRILEQAVNA